MTAGLAAASILSAASVAFGAIVGSFLNACIQSEAIVLPCL